LSSTIVIHVLRPYANEEEYLAAEGYSIDSKSMLLIDQPALTVDAAVIFDVQLENGHKPIRAEAKVMGHVAPVAGKAGGLRVRFKRFGAATKAFIDRAIAAAAAKAPAPSAEGPESSGIHRRPVMPVPAPVNREELLQRLRGRAQNRPPAGESRAGEQSA
jgi:hypothetical protein